MKPQVMVWQSPRGRRMALVARGRKMHHIVVMDSGGLRVIKRRGEQAYLQPADYPAGRARQHFNNAAAQFGATKAARQLIRGI